MSRTAPRSIRHALQEAKSTLDGTSPTPRLDAELLLARILGQNRSYLLCETERNLTPAEEARLDALLRRRLQGEPVAYLLGQWGFWTFMLDVTPAVLIPRPETEILVEQALALLAATPAPRILDLGTGSGAIAIALAQERPDAEIWAVERSSDALTVAQANGERLAPRIHWRRGSWFAPLPDALRFDLIVSNPPYVAAGDAHLAMLGFEPRDALVGGVDGLAALRAIIAHAPRHLCPGGHLCLEHGWDQGAAVRALLEAHGFEGVRTQRDLGRHERISHGSRSSSS